MDKASLPTGFRFCPTDVELVEHYLKRKVSGKSFRFEAIGEIDIYKYSPWNLPDKSVLRTEDLKWYFFCPREKKYAVGVRSIRSTDTGYWKPTGQDRLICYNAQVVGMKKKLVFYTGKAPKGVRTDWVMHEYRLEDKDLSEKGVAQDAYALCVVCKKDGPGPKDGAQYGKPFEEEEWNDDDEEEEVLKGGEAVSPVGQSVTSFTKSFNPNISGAALPYVLGDVFIGSFASCPDETPRSAHQPPVISGTDTAAEEADQFVYDEDDILAISSDFLEETAFILDENENTELWLETVFKLDLHDKKIKQKAMMMVSGLEGVNSAAINMKEKKLTVTGNVDPVHVLSKLRKICNAKIVSVAPTKQPEMMKEKAEEEEPKKQEEKKKDTKDKASQLASCILAEDAEAVFDSWRSRATEDGLFLEFEQEAAGGSLEKETPAKDVPPIKAVVAVEAAGGRKFPILKQPRDAEEVAQSGTNQSRSTATSLETGSEIANIEEVPVQSGTLYSLRQSDRPSEMSPEAMAQNQRILMLGGMALTEPPECQEWERYTQIYLMENEFSELPENLRCPVLQVLFLNRNSRLRMIPQSFFNNMPALNILNLSRTRIKCLPKSLFELINLKKLFLNHCELLMRLPLEIGQLQNLEVLDLEGTRITNLPREVQQLTNLTCLEVSFNEPVNHRRLEQLHELIPVGVLTTLRQLQELNIDVSLVDKRWNACVAAVVSEICRLTTLNTLKIYLPQVELLSRFDWYLSHFRLTVGHHIKRVMSRIPDDTEMEMEQYDRCLKYVNGAGVPEEVKIVLGHTNAFFVDRHTDVKALSEFGCENLVQLKWCMVAECNELKAIIHGDQMDTCSSYDKNVGLAALEYLHLYYMKNFRSICEGPICRNGFISLKKLTLRTCPQLTTILTPELLASFNNLEELLVDDCPVITSLVSHYNSRDESISFLPKLKKISLHYLPKFSSISGPRGVNMSPVLEWMSFYKCPNLLCLPISKACHTSLKKIKGEVSWWNGLQWEGNQQHSWDDTFVPIVDCD